MTWLSAFTSKPVNAEQEEANRTRGNNLLTDVKSLQETDAVKVKEAERSGGGGGLIEKGPLYEPGCRVQFLAEGGWVSATVVSKAEGEAAKAEEERYQVVLPPESRQEVTALPRQLRTSPAAGELIEVFSNQGEGRWKSAQVVGKSGTTSRGIEVSVWSNTGVLGDGGFVRATVPPHRVRRLYPAGQRVEIYVSPKLGWQPYRVHSAAGVNGANCPPAPNQEPGEGALASPWVLVPVCSVAVRPQAGKADEAEVEMWAESCLIRNDSIIDL